MDGALAKQRTAVDALTRVLDKQPDAELALDHAEQAELDIEQAEKFLLLVNTSLGPPPKDGVHVATVSQGTAAELEADSRHGKSLARQIIATMEGLLVAVRKFEQQEALAPQAAACGELIIALNSYLQALAPAIERLLRAQGKGPGSFKVRMGGGHMLHLGITLVVVLFCSWLLVQYYQRVRAGIPIRSLGQGAP